MSFYNFYQNNSGGHLTINDKLCHNLYIEADTFKEALEKAKSFGVYFNGVANGKDCECCGDRWSNYERQICIPNEQFLSVYTEDILGVTKHNYVKDWQNKYGKCKRKEEPAIRKQKHSQYEEYGAKVVFESIEEYAQWLANEFGYGEPDSRIFYKDGRVVEIKQWKKE